MASRLFQAIFRSPVRSAAAAQRLPSSSPSLFHLSPFTSAFTRHFSSSPSPFALARPKKIKLKTHKGAAKRWLTVGNGNFKRSKAGRVHLNSTMGSTQLNRLGKPTFASPQQKRLLRRLLPYA